MGLELTILRDQAGRSNHWATGDSKVSKGEMRIFDGSQEPLLLREPHRAVTQSNNDLANKLKTLRL